MHIGSRIVRYNPFARYGTVIKFCGDDCVHVLFDDVKHLEEIVCMLIIQLHVL
jgi:hypothetical protein